MPEPLRLHIGGTQPKPGWKMLNIKPGPGVDYVGSATDLSVFRDGMVDELYGSHIYEHLGYNDELLQALREAYRVLRPGGVIKVGVPDMDVLCRMFLDPNLDTESRWEVVRMIYGGQTDQFDFHKGGFNLPILTKFLEWAGFRNVQQVQVFNLFDDITSLTFRGTPISLNVTATKP